MRGLLATRLARAVAQSLSAAEAAVAQGSASPGRRTVLEALAVAQQSAWGHPAPLRACSSSSKPLAAAFTCGVCDTRTVKRFSSEAYHRGVVIARCPGCDNQHLIADRLGWFGAPGSIDEFLAEQGQGSRKATVHADGTLELDETALSDWSKQHRPKG